MYVDKTEHIYNLFKDDKYFFIARPRRFGKSLLCATLVELFKGNREIFKGLWIDSSDWHWQQHPVIHLDMSNASSKTATVATMHEGICNMLRHNAKALGITELGGSTPGFMLADLIEKAKEVTGQNVVVIIDEYDKPILDVIDHKAKHTEIHAELSDFYSQLKPAESFLKFVLITGVFKFTKTSLFSNLNNLKDITFSPKAGAVVGYTEQEVRAFFAEHLAALAAKNKMSVDDMMVKLREQYNGYAFGVDLDTGEFSNRVYNSYGLNYVFAEQQQLKKWFESGSPTSLIKKLAANNFADLDSSNLSMPFATLDRSCTPQDLGTTNTFASEEHNDGDIASLTLLYYAGYLTLQQYHDQDIFLGFPNQEIATEFSSALLPLLLNQRSTTMIKIMRKI